MSTSHDELVFDARVALPEAQERFQRAEAECDRFREVLRQADEELLLIADEASEAIGERVDSVRALLKDAL